MRRLSDTAIVTWTVATVVGVVATYTIYRNVMQQVYWNEAFTDSSSKRTKTVVINLDREPEKFKLFQQRYTGDHIQRFSAIDGNAVPYSDWLTADALEQLDEADRSYHYELSRGAVGCFLSHYSVCRQCIKDGEHDVYLVFEDDAAMEASSFSRDMKRALASAPDDWDILLLGAHRKAGEMVNEGNDVWCKPTGFWGTYGYLVNKRGAAAFVKEVDRTAMDGQIDAYLSRMQQREQINIYLMRIPLVFMDYANMGGVNTLQKGVRAQPGVDPFDFKGYSV